MAQYCPQCGARTYEADRFCRSCGASLKIPDAVTPADAEGSTPDPQRAPADAAASPPAREAVPAADALVATSPEPVFTTRRVYRWPLWLVASGLLLSVAAMGLVALLDGRRERASSLAEPVAFSSAPVDVPDDAAVNAAVDPAALDAVVAAVLAEEPGGPSAGSPPDPVAAGTPEPDLSQDDAPDAGAAPDTGDATLADRPTESADSPSPPSVPAPASAAPPTTTAPPAPPPTAPVGAIPLDDLAIPSGTLVLSSDFEVDADVWEVASTDSYRVWAEEGKYHMEVLEPNMYRVSEPFPEFMDDFVMRAVVRQVPGEPVKWGIVLRRGGALDSHYVLYNHLGELRVGRTADGRSDDFVLWEPGAPPSFVGQPAELVVASRGPRLTVWLDDLAVFDEDVPGPTSGMVGLIVGAYDDVPARVSFDYVQLESLP